MRFQSQHHRQPKTLFASFDVCLRACVSLLVEIIAADLISQRRHTCVRIQFNPISKTLHFEFYNDLPPARNEITTGRLTLDLTLYAIPNELSNLEKNIHTHVRTRKYHLVISSVTQNQISNWNYHS